MEEQKQTNIEKIKGLFILILPLGFILSTLILNPYLQSIKQFEYVNMSLILFILLVLFIISYGVYLSKIVNKSFAYNLKIKNLIKIILLLIFIYSISVFVHPDFIDIFFLNMLIINLGASIILSFIVAVIINKLLKK